MREENWTRNNRANFSYHLTRMVAMNRRLAMLVAAAAAAVTLPMALEGQIGTFAPDWTFKGSTLNGMQQVGQATWKAENGEIVATPTSPDGGWLLLTGGYQDVQAGGEF